MLDVENTMPENRNTLKNSLMNLFGEGVDYYTQLLTDLSITYRVDLALYYNPMEPSDGVDRMARHARISAHKCLLCFDDQARWVYGGGCITDNNATLVADTGSRSTQAPTMAGPGNITPRQTIWR